MRSARFRLASRVFATLLLAWTAVDLCGHALCLHQHGPIVPGVPAADGQAASVRVPGAAPVDAGHGDSLDQCFYCGHCTDVQAPFRIRALPGLASGIFAEFRCLPDLAPSPLYHPPLA